MNYMNTHLLKKGDEIRVIAPSLSGGGKSYLKNYDRAVERLRVSGFKVTFGKYINEQFQLGTARREHRAADFNDAYADKNVKLVLALSGGWACNEILPLIDWEIVKQNPKPLAGFSDISVLVNAIYAQASIVNYLGPTLGRLGQMVEPEYTLDYFLKAIRGLYPIDCKKSRRYGESRKDMKKTPAWKVLQTGKAKGILLGGNLGSLFLLPGTPYALTFDKPFIWILEDDDEDGKYSPQEVSRRFEAWLQQSNFCRYLTGLIVGRFQHGSRMTRPKLEGILSSKNLGGIPIVYDMDFGHTQPMLTLPIGGEAELIVEKDVSFRLL